MQDKTIKIIIDTNLWISFLIGLNASSTITNILTNGNMTIERCQIMALAKFKQHYL